MLTIKFKRIGKKHQPGFRLVVQEKRSKVDGRFIEDLGFYNPLRKETSLKKERIEYRLKTGAQPTASVHNLLVRQGIVGGPKTPVHKKAKSAGETEKPASVSVAAETSSEKEGVENDT